MEIDSRAKRVHTEASMIRTLAALALALASSLLGCSDRRLLDETLSPPEPDPACVPVGTKCPVVFRYPLGNGVTSVDLRGDFAPDGWTKGVPMQVEGTYYQAEVAAEDGATIRYKFVLNGKDWVKDPTNGWSEPDGVGGENSVRVAECDFEVCTPEPPKPNPNAFDWRSAVLYFVFVDRFRNGDPANDGAVPGVAGPANYQGGDWRGVIDKLEDGYFESLGVNALWLTVPQDNPSVAGLGSDGRPYSGYHGYWVSDLDRPEEHFGTLDTLKELVEVAHARGIKVLLDYAMNHVHEANPIVAQHPDWFWPLAYEGKSCVCGNGCDWNDPYQQRRCWFTPYLPDWNFTNAEARAYSVGNAIDWIEKTGIDGFRLDAVKHIELAWLLDLRKRVAAEIEPKTGEHFYMVGETFESGNRDVLKTYVGPDRLDGQFDFPLRAVLAEKILRRTGTMHDLDGFLATNDAYYPGIMSTFIGNHDILRTVHVAEDQPWDAWAPGLPWDAPPPLPKAASPFERLGVAYTFLFTTKGVPLLYYGDEVGMAGAGDPDNRRFMQWEGLDPNQIALRKLVAKLGQIRREHSATWRGARSTIAVTDDTYAYSMSDGSDMIYVALNRSDSPRSVEGMPKKGRDLLSDTLLTGPTVSLAPRSARVIVAE